jgi:hypothetical protein
VDGKTSDGVDVGLRRALGVVAHAEIFEHPLTEYCHGFLRCCGDGHPLVKEPILLPGRAGVRVDAPIRPPHVVPRRLRSLRERLLSVDSYRAAVSFNKHLVTYHGVFAPAASARDRVVPEPPDHHLVDKPAHDCDDAKPATEPATPSPELVPRSRRPFSWAELLKRVFRIDALVCDHCGGARRVLAAIVEADAIHRILSHLGLPTGEGNCTL